MCNTGANAGTDVETQNLQPQSPRLPEDLSVSEVAADGGPASRTHKATDNQKEKTKKLYKQHVQQQCREYDQQRRQQEEDPGGQPEPVHSGTCKSLFALRPKSLAFPLHPTQWGWDSSLN